jgi:hypothetical protein
MLKVQFIAHLTSLEVFMRLVFKNGLVLLASGLMALSCVKRNSDDDDTQPQMKQDENGDGVPDSTAQTPANTPAEVKPATAEEKKTIEDVVKTDPTTPPDAPQPKSIAGTWQIASTGAAADNYRTFLKFERSKISMTISCFDKYNSVYITKTASVAGSFDDKSITLNDALSVLAASAEKTSSGAYKVECSRTIPKGTYAFSMAANGQLAVKLAYSNYTLVPSGATGGAITSSVLVWQEISNTNKIFWRFEDGKVSRRVECNVGGQDLVATASASAAYDATVGTLRILESNSDRKYAGEETCLADLVKGSYAYSSARNEIKLFYNGAEATLRNARGMFFMTGTSGDTYFTKTFFDSMVTSTITCKDGTETFTAVVSAKAVVAGSSVEVLESKSATASSSTRRVSCSANISAGKYKLYYTDATGGIMFDYNVVQWRMSHF